MAGNPEDAAQEPGRPLSIWLLSDGRPGHYQQSEGVVAALQLAGYEVRLERIPLRLRFGLCRTILRSLLNHTSAAMPLWWLRMFVAFPSLPAQGPDLVLSTGGRTAFANAWFARLYGCANILIGHPRRLDCRHFAALFTVFPVSACASHQLLPVAPTPTDEADRRRQGETLLEELDAGEVRLWAMLVGGDGAGYRYQGDDWLALADFMNRAAERNGIRWLITTSPRTGVAGEGLLRERLDPHVLAETVWYGTDPLPRLPAYLHVAERVYCSEDSMSMWNQAVAAGCPVVTLRPADARPDARFTQVLKRFVEERRLLRESLADADTRPEPVLAIKTLSEDPLLDLGQRVASVLSRYQ